MDYIKQLGTLVCHQVDEFIKGVIHSDNSAERYVANKVDEDGRKEYGSGHRVNELDWTFDARRNQLMKKKPRSLDDNEFGIPQLVPELDSTGSKVLKDYSYAVNDPKYEDNLLDMLNTPFDHIDRIILQDFTKVLTCDDNNYFKDLIEFGFNGDGVRYGVNSIRFSDGVDSVSDFEFKVHGDKKYLDFSGSEYIVDSYTYTPFIDYSSSSENIRAGVYSDDFLTKYNSLWFDDRGNSEMVDVNRRNMSSNLYELWNLERDLYDAKVSFRNAIKGVDSIILLDGTVVNRNSKDSIYVFCDHLFKLFAKLSNVRMCHEFYGLKTPHVKWEGMLALDVWYNLLYRNIDQKYLDMFHWEDFDRNPMSRCEVHGDNEVIVYGKSYTLINYDGKVEKGIAQPKDDNGIELTWMLDPTFPGYVLVWNYGLFVKHDDTAQKICSGRRDFLTPTGVLRKIYHIVDSFNDIEDVCDVSSGDFEWFKQRGKVYSDSSKSQYTKYMNLHLGAAYDAMTPVEYCKFVGKEPEDGEDEYRYVKPGILPSDDAINVKQRMIERGCLTLIDAFKVMKHNRIFNIYNSKQEKIEEFNPYNVNDYSDSQSAIVIERVFSELYEYLHFKSTTQETYQKHINIDQGYKYLTNDALKGSENPISNLYYDLDNDVPYLRYISLIEHEYLNVNSERSRVLDDMDEKKVLANAINRVLKYKPRYLNEKFDLCPLCNNYSTKSKQSPRLVSDSIDEGTSDEGTSDEGTSDKVYLDIMFCLSNHMTLKEDTWNSFPQYMLQISDAQGKLIGLRYVGDRRGFKFQMSQIQISPRFDYKDEYGFDYKLIGYASKPYQTSPEYSISDVITETRFTDNKRKLTLYPVWQRQYVVVFDSGDAKDSTHIMENMIISSDQKLNVPICPYEYDSKIDMFRYYDGEDWEHVEPSSEKIDKFKFDGWECNLGQNKYVLNELETVLIDKPITSYPVVHITAKWTLRCNMMRFQVNGKPYCDVLIDKSTNLLKYPDKNPVLADRVKKFIGWSVLEGTRLDKIPEYDNVVCESSDEDKLVCLSPSDSEGKVVCIDDEIRVYRSIVNARVWEQLDIEYRLTFRYLNDEGEWTDVYVDLSENEKVPFFHLHQRVNCGSGDVLVFRNWVVESGSITSSLTILSDVVLVASYDHVIESAGSEIQVEYHDERKLYESEFKQEDCQELVCEYANSDIIEGKTICTFNRTNPKSGDVNGKGVLVVNCPRINELHIPSHEKNDFEFGTVLEIGDVANLIKALLKINIDIAHREYYLKKDLPNDSDWWYGQVMKGYDLVCKDSDNDICSENPSELPVVCSSSGYPFYTKWISFEPTVELKFSNFHSSNQIVDGNRLLCTVANESESRPRIIPINRELASDEFGLHYNDCLYCYDYINDLKKVMIGGNTEVSWETSLDDLQRYYDIEPLHLYENSKIQSPTDVTGFVKHRLHQVHRGQNQLQTFVSIVKKYRPIVIPKVYDIFDKCDYYKTRYQAQVDNSYGVFGWSQIPSKTMINMECNEDSILVPSSYGAFNRIGGSKFLQLDPDLSRIYRHYSDDKLTSNAEDSWYWLYAKRDWTYFLAPFFNVKQNNEVYSELLDQFNGEVDNPLCPSNSNHLNGVIFEKSARSRTFDPTFEQVQRACQFLARHHHGQKNLDELHQGYLSSMSYEKLKELTGDEDDFGDFQFNSKYGSSYYGNLGSLRFPDYDWVDEYDKSGSYVGDSKFKYNLGQAHSIDDFDDESVWMYITMVSPLDDVDQVIELEDIMPFVFWWSNRGSENNGPTVDCYGLQGNAKLNYEYGGYCYESAQKKVNPSTGEEMSEQKWHSVKRTLGTDFSNIEYGGIILNQDDSGNVYRGAFDPYCSGTDSKWKVHHSSNAFGTNQHSDPQEDKYWNGSETHGNEKVSRGLNPEFEYELNNDICESIDGRPMTWNLWNVIRHYAYIRYFVSKGRKLGSDQANWIELEGYVKKIVREIYRTFYQKFGEECYHPTFSEVDGSMNNLGEPCVVRWTNSFIQVSSMLERNEREHQASLVLFTGDNRNVSYEDVRNSIDNFRVESLGGYVDLEDGEDGIRSPDSTESEMDSSYSEIHMYNGYKYKDFPQKFILGDSIPYKQSYDATDVIISGFLDLDLEYPESEYQMDLGKGEIDTTKKWVRKLTHACINHQVLPVYTSMESFALEGKNHRQLTEKDLKSITFQVIPQLYWKYDWSFNDYMIHRVGELDGVSKEHPMYDMLGNVWELVRDDYNETVKDGIGEMKFHGEVNNPIVQKSPSVKKVIRGGAFDQFLRKNITSSREGIETDSNTSEFGTQPNVGFRPILMFSSEQEASGFNPGTDKIDLFFLFDASASQNTQLQTIMNQAQQIVKHFTGRGKGNDVCRVGSAMFLGPKMRLMCSHLVQQNPISDVYWYEYEKREWDGLSKTPVEYKTIYNSTIDRRKKDGKKVIGHKGEANDYESILQTIDDFRNSWDGKVQGIPSVVPSKMLLREGSHSSGSGSPPADDPVSGWYTKRIVTPIQLTSAHYIYMHCGVPSYVDADGNLCFGDEDSGFNGNYSLFNYDPSVEGIETFDFPFSYDPNHIGVNPNLGIDGFNEVDYRGTLSNWYSGDEPVCQAISNLLGSGMLHKPRNYDGSTPSQVPGVGFMFRPDVPKLVFVFSNEFDNNMRRYFSSSYSPSQETEYVKPSRDAKEIKLPDQNPPDSYCMQTLLSSDIDLKNFLDSINLGDKFNLYKDFKDYSKIGDSLQKLTYNVKVYAKPDIIYSYDELYTDGKFELDDTMKEIDEPINTYLMVSNANAPEFLYDTSDITLNDRSSSEEVAKVADSIFINNDSRLISDLFDVNLPSSIGSIFQQYGISNPTYSHLAITNQLYLRNRKFIGNKYNPLVGDVFGFISPYERMNLVYGLRKNVGFMKREFEQPDDIQYWGYNRDKNGTVDTSDNARVIMLISPDSVDGGEFNSHMLGMANDEQFKEFNAYDRKSGNTAKFGKGKVLTNYITNGVMSDESPESSGVSWQDKHICPYDDWKNTNKMTQRKKQGKMCIYNLGIDNLQLIGCWVMKVDWTTDKPLYKVGVAKDTGKAVYGRYLGDNGKGTTHYYWCSTQDVPDEDGDWDAYFNPKNWFMVKSSIEIEETYRESISEKQILCFPDINVIRNFCLCQFKLYENFSCGNNTSVGDDTQEAPMDYVTLEYPKGGLKIVHLTQNAWSRLHGASPLVQSSSNLLDPLIDALTSTDNVEYPTYFRDSLTQYAKTIKNATKYKQMDKCKASANELWANWKVVDFARNFYGKLKSALPLMLAYRYYFQICGRITNKQGKLLSDYKDSQNSNVMKPMPITKVNDIKNNFTTCFGNGQFTNGSQFSFNSCVVDLCPEISSDGSRYVNEEYSGLQPSEVVFPVKFSGSINPNSQDGIYKTKKILLTKIDEISASGTGNSTKFDMGSRSSYYDEVTDPLKRINADKDAILDGSQEDNVQVTLTNGGSYQKNQGFYAIQGSTENQVDSTESNMKYYMNKHLFVDPFELTIAQWCYVWRESNSIDSNEAKELLENNGADIEEMAKSYWRYMQTWHMDEVDEMKLSTARDEVENWLKVQAWVDEQDDVRRYPSTGDIYLEAYADSSESEVEYKYNGYTLEQVNEECQKFDNGKSAKSVQFELKEIEVNGDYGILENIHAFVSIITCVDDETYMTCDRYNPLEDMRPYYYATYDKVRGTSDVYQEIGYKDVEVYSEGGELIRYDNGNPESSAYGYVFNNQDEYQLESRVRPTMIPVEPMSFLDILNSKSRFHTGQRVYDFNKDDGGIKLRGYMVTRDGRNEIISSREYNQQTDARWGYGRNFGLNFDLPTEAQWEYCCRGGSSYAIPSSFNLGKNFEEKNKELDLIAWYKYKIIGSKPEPERFCAWRISKMMFGISKNLEQVNNVYEMTSPFETEEFDM